MNKFLQQAKVEYVRSPELLQPLAVPNQAWQVICMDFMEGLPKSQKYDTILVVVDKYSTLGRSPIEVL